MNDVLRVGIVGGTGYTGVELLRILVEHPQVDLRVITSRSNVGTRVADMFPNLRGFTDLAFVEPDIKSLALCDVVFFATPNGTAMQSVPELLENNIKVIDLAADFRLRDEKDWAKWYGMPHACPQLLAQAVYGLAECNREQIKQANLVANPGCYPTAVQLGFLPLLEAGVIEVGTLIADTKSGASGAGRQANVNMLLCESSENFKAYGVPGHRHLPEIKQGLQRMAGQGSVGVTFVPHLIPMIRGIHATLYASLTTDSVDLQALFERRYESETFVDVLSEGAHPETRSVRGSNVCRLAVHRPLNGRQVVVLSVIDNLVKGAAGQAVQNMNIMSGIEERMGLDRVALLP